MFRKFSFSEARMCENIQKQFNIIHNSLKVMHKIKSIVSEKSYNRYITSVFNIHSNNISLHFCLNI